MYSTEQNPSWDANSRSFSQDRPRLLWNSRVRHSVHKTHLLAPIVSHLNLVHNLQPYSIKFHFNIIFLFRKYRYTSTYS
jgi:hypothetical protein